ncbi:membrane protein [Actinomycetospora sp. NBRC 106378]|nr:membrane protein [Actinomycetospora sp. NBRC 106378]
MGLGTFLAGAGLSHLTVARRGFRAQVPDFVPLEVDRTVVLSGVAEIALGTALAALPSQRRRVGTLAALFFTAVFPGNVAQWRHRRDGLGLNSDRTRFLRLFAQPVPIAVALWSTGVVPRR